METSKHSVDIGFVITKSPFESKRVEGALKMAKDAIAQGHSVGIFLISDGVFLAKRGQKNKVADLFNSVLSSSEIVIASQDHLVAAGISKDEMLEHIEISENIYDDLVEQVMERWGRVVSI